MKYRDHDISRGQSRTKTILFRNFFINDIGYYQISIQFWRYVIIANRDEEKVYTITLNGIIILNFLPDS